VNFTAFPPSEHLTERLLFFRWKIPEGFLNGLRLRCILEGWAVGADRDKKDALGLSMWLRKTVRRCASVTRWKPSFPKERRRLRN